MFNLLLSTDININEKIHAPYITEIWNCVNFHVLLNVHGTPENKKNRSERVH